MKVIFCIFTYLIVEIMKLKTIFLLFRLLWNLATPIRVAILNVIVKDGGKTKRQRDIDVRLVLLARCTDHREKQRISK